MSIYTIIMKKNLEKVSDFTYLSETMQGNKRLIKEIIDVFIKQVSEDISYLKKEIELENFSWIKKISHTMKSSASIMGISSALPILNQMQELAQRGESINEIRELNKNMTKIMEQAIEEITAIREDYV